MPFIPHTDEEVQAMLTTLGIDQVEALFAEIPAALRQVSFADIPLGITEMELSRLMQERAKADGSLISFLGAGAYQHHIPAAVWDVATRGEFMTAYTPYQAEASQGTLQLIYEFQTMIASLNGMEVANASLYDGATALSEAILMAVRLARLQGKARILMPRSIHPFYRQTVKTIISQQEVEVIEIAYRADTGKVDFAALQNCDLSDVAALIIPQPNFFGQLEDVDLLTDWAKEKGLYSIAVVNPLAIALLKPPGQWGKAGVDIACGEGQPLGIPLASGGPYYGFLTCKKAHVRQMPGRIVGKTVDVEGKDGYVLTLQAREQHIRRGKATSNICTNQGLMVTASTIYMSLMGPLGLRQIAALCHSKAQSLIHSLSTIKGIETVFSGPNFHEVVLRFNYPVEDLLKQLANYGIQGGFALKSTYPELGDALLICTTEMRSAEDIDYLKTCLDAILNARKSACQT